MNKNVISLQAMENLMKNSGVGRVSETSKKALRTHLEDVGENIVKEALLNATHAGRKTVQGKDISLVIKNRRRL